MPKRALLIGINKHSTSPRFDLRGCQNDVLSLRELLVTRYSFDPAAITILTDNQATRAAILGGLTHLIQSAGPDDTLVFGFAGHGTQKGTSTPEESDGTDEALVPYDVSYDNLITDNEIFETYNKRVANQKVTFFFDCCHSGPSSSFALRLKDG